MLTLAHSGHTGTIYDLAVLQTPGQPRLFSASYDKTIRVRTIVSQLTHVCMYMMPDLNGC